MMKIRPEVSRRNPYWINKNRYYELKYFCLQYNDWRKEYSNLNGYPEHSCSVITVNNQTAGYTEDNILLRRLHLKGLMDLVAETCNEASPELGVYIFKGVTEGRSYEYLKTKLEIPCGRDMYYDRYRKFFWLLDRKR